MLYEIFLSIVALSAGFCLGLSFLSMNRNWDKVGSSFIGLFTVIVLIWFPVISIIGLIFDNNPLLFISYLCISIIFWILVIKTTMN